MPTGYCVKCKSKQEFDNAVEKMTKNGRKILQGNCKVCGTKVNVFLKSDNPVESKTDKKADKRSNKTESSRKGRASTPHPQKAKKANHSGNRKRKGEQSAGSDSEHNSLDGVPEDSASESGNQSDQ